VPEALDPEAKENFWTQYWLKEALKENPDQLAKGHLSAYLEETCYWTAITTAQKLTNSGFTWMDCFQIARAAAAEPMKFFAKYDSNRSRFHTYSQLKLKTAILETIRAGREKEKYSQAGLLRSLTKTLLKKSLEKAGIRESQLPNICSLGVALKKFTSLLKQLEVKNCYGLMPNNWKRSLIAIISYVCITPCLNRSEPLS